MNLTKNNKGQISFEGIIGATVAVIMILILSVSVFFPIYNIFSDNLASVPGGFGNTAGTILLVAMFVIFPLVGMIIVLRSATQRRQDDF